MSTTDTLAAVVAEHAYDTGWRCSCGWTGTWGEYNDHLGAALRPAVDALLAEARREAWSEGYIAHGYFRDFHKPQGNPYVTQGDQA